MGVEEAMKRHPAGSLLKRAEQSPHDLGWALAKSAELARVAERERIIKLLETSCGQNDCNCEIRISHAIALIDGGDK